MTSAESINQVAVQVVAGDCPTCAGMRQCDVVREFTVDYDDEETGIWTKTEYRIMQCRGCLTVFFQESMQFSENMDYRDTPGGDTEPYYPKEVKQWPPRSSRTRPEWSDELALVDLDLQRMFLDIYTALDNDLRVLAAIGIRTVFDRASEKLGVDPAKTFVEKIADLRKQGWIGESESEILDTLTDAGNAAAHRGWKPTASDLGTMMNVIESFLYRALVIPSEAKTLKDGIPAKPERKKK